MLQITGSKTANGNCRSTLHCSGPTPASLAGPLNSNVSHQMHRPAYGEVLGLWEIEGSLRDIYIPQVGLFDWKKLLELSSRFICTYTFDGATSAPPEVESIFSNRGGSHLLRVNLGTVTANCHFFVVSEIELDLDPREIQSPKAHGEVLSFIESLAGAVGKQVLLTPENGERIPYLSFEPIGGKWHAYA
ncbi:hypothetical protein [Roseateles sp. PN1]|uniref:hypothetical protein n=1 Tax=Roseateles sp. PN1 TaxID=3137372 RepID=UPI0031387B0D